jgi:hypothetical protein
VYIDPAWVPLTVVPRLDLAPVACEVVWVAGSGALAGEPSACRDVGSSGCPSWPVLVAVVGLVPIHAVWLWCWHDLTKLSWRFFASFRSFLGAWGEGWAAFCPACSGAGVLRAVFGGGDPGV